MNSETLADFAASHFMPTPRAHYIADGTDLDDLPRMLVAVTVGQLRPVATFKAVDFCRDRGEGPPQ